MGVRKVVRRLIGAGALLTWVLTLVAAYFLLGLGVQLSALLGAILVRRSRRAEGKETGQTRYVSLRRTQPEGGR